MNSAIGLRTLPLVLFSFVEIAVAFLRMIILTHILGPYEFGLVAGVSAAYATFEQITDMSIYRFVLSSARPIYSEAVAGAHAVTVLRGIVVAGLILSFSFPVSCALGSCRNWPTFALLAPVYLIKSFENLQIWVAERDYQDWPQLTTSLLSHGCGLLAMTMTAYETGSHYSFVVYRRTGDHICFRKPSSCFGFAEDQFRNTFFLESDAVRPTSRVERDRPSAHDPRRSTYGGIPVRANFSRPICGKQRLFRLLCQSLD